MTYSFVHRKINEEAFPKAINLYNHEQMTGRGRGKYWYKRSFKKKREKDFLEKILTKYFKENKIMYIV